MSSLERFKYQMFKRWNSKAIKMGRKFYGVPSTVNNDLHPARAYKSSQLWEMAEIYYAIPKDEDTIKHMI